MRPTSSKQRQAIRRQRNSALAIKDAAGRCGCCKRALPASFVIVIGANGAEQKFCNHDCHYSWVERQQFQRREA